MSIAENLARVQALVLAACRKAHRDPASVALMAVSKVHPVESLLEAYAAGLRLFGENRVQEWQEKSQAAAGLAGLEMHLIGPLQSNKTVRAAELFHAVDTVDSARIATRLNEAARARGHVLPVSIEVKLSAEDTKHGVSPADLPALVTCLAGLKHLLPVGLMAVPAWPADLANAGEEARPTFSELRRLRDECRKTIPTIIGLSMGMSNDFAAAIEEGSTCIRLGTAIFGERKNAGN